MEVKISSDNAISFTTWLTEIRWYVEKGFTVNYNHKTGEFHALKAEKGGG